MQFSIRPMCAAVFTLAVSTAFVATRCAWADVASTAESAAPGAVAPSTEEVPQPLPPLGEGQGADANPLKLASFPRDFTTPLLDQPDNPTLLPEAVKPSL